MIDTEELNSDLNTIFRHNPFQSERTKDVEMIILHSIGESINGSYITDYLKENGLSTHYIIDSHGFLGQIVHPMLEAYHAGESQWRGKTDLNRYSIGVHFMIGGRHSDDSFLRAINDPDSFDENAVYNVGARLCAHLVHLYPKLTVNNILPHSWVSGDHVRGAGKGVLDVGDGFDLGRFLINVNSELQKIRREPPITRLRKAIGI